MKASARNKLQGTITHIAHGPVTTEVTLELPAGDQLVATVTSESATHLALAVGKKAVGLVKAPSVLLITNADGYQFSARNQFSGVVTHITTGAVNSEVVLRLAGGTSISAIVTNDAVDELQLSEGTPAVALIKASQVVIGVAQ